MAANVAIGIDLGGTNIKIGVVRADGSVALRRSVETRAAEGVPAVLDRLAKLIDELVSDCGVTRADVSGVGFGAPGPLSHIRGFIFACPNLPGWVNVPLRDLFQERTKLPVAVENDANAAAYGEFVAGAGRGCRDMVMLTLGTGVGAGIVMNGALQRGAFDNAGEIGHVIAVPRGRPCPCGQAGCFERYASANAVRERFLEAAQAGEKTTVNIGGKLTANDVAEAARKGDALATRIWDETCEHIALGCVNLQHMLNPQRVVLGGGLINAGEQLLDPVRRHFERLTWKIAQDQPRIEFAQLGDDAGIVGAAALARLARQDAP